MKNLNYGHSNGKKREQIRIQFGKVYHDKVFHILYFSTYEPRAMKKRNLEIILTCYFDMHNLI